MTQLLNVVYEKGTFRLLTPPTPGLSEGQQVRLVIETPSPEKILALDAQVYAGLSEEDIEDIERIALDRFSFFSGRESCEQFCTTNEILPLTDAIVM